LSSLDYAPVGPFYDEEDEERRRGDYPPVEAPGGPSLGSQPLAAAPASGSTADLETPADQSRKYTPVEPSHAARGPAAPAITNEMESGASKLRAMNANSYAAPEPPSASITNEMESGASTLRSMNANTLGAASVAAPSAAPAIPPRPQWKDYAPAELHGLRRFAHNLAQIYFPQLQYARDARRDRAYRTAPFTAGRNLSRQAA
jgi:hypothetical protein